MNPAYEKPFEVSAQAIANLTSDQFVAFVAHLIRAEIALYGGAPSDLLGNFALGPDGGRDASTTRVAPLRDGDGFVPRGETVWQCKAEQSTPNETELANEISKEKPTACLERDGGYTFLAQNPPNDEDEIDARLKGIALSNGFDEGRVRFFAQTRLAEFARRHPSLSLLSFFRVRPEGLDPFELWAREHEIAFEPSAHSTSLQELCAGIRSGRFHAAVTGPTGVGKSRLVLEAVRQLDLQGFVAYARSPGPAVDKLVDHIRMHRVSCILVVDECDEANAAVLRERLAVSSTGLITIGADREGSASRPPVGDVLVRLRPLPEEVISKVLEANTGLDTNARRWIASQTGGFIKLAKLVGEELARDSAAVGDLAHVSAATEVERALSRMLGNDLRKVQLLKLLACFSAVDHSPGPDGSELMALAGKLQISVLDLESLTARLRQEQILADTGSLVYVTPDLLAQWLLESFLLVHSASFMQWLPTLPDRLRGAHARQLERLRGTQGGRAWAAKLVGPTGPFGDLLTRRQPWADDALLALSAAAKGAAIDYVASWAQHTDDAATQIAERPTLQWVLFRLMRSAYGFEMLFGLLVDAFEVTAERTSGHIWELLKSMTIAAGLSSTLAPYQKVVDSVKLELSHRSASVRAALLRALGDGLVSPLGKSYSEYDREPDDNGRDPTPFVAIKSAIELLVRALDDSAAEARQAAADFFIKSARPFMGSPLVEEYLAAIPKALAISGDIGTFAQELDAVLAYDAPQEDIAARIRDLRTALAGDVRSRVRLAIQGWSIVDSHDDGALRPTVDSVADEIARLSQDELASIVAMMFEPWAKNPAELLSAIAKRAGSKDVWPLLLSSGRNAQNAWPCALFLSSARDAGREPAPNAMALLAGDRFDVQIAALTITMSASTDKEVESLAQLLVNGEADPSWTRGCYMGRWNERVSPIAVVTLIRGLISCDGGGGVAVSLCYRALESKQPVPNALVIEAMTTAIVQVSGHDKWTWERVGIQLAKDSPEDVLNALLEAVLAHGLGQADDELETVFTACCERRPLLAAQLLRLWEKHPYFLTQKLGSIVTQYVPVETLVAWATADDDKQGALGDMVLASDSPLTVSLVERFGENSRLASAIEAAAGSGSWSGSVSGFYESRGRDWKAYAAKATTPRFARFADRVGRRLLASAERARKDEADEEALDR